METRGTKRVTKDRSHKQSKKNSVDRKLTPIQTTNLDGLVENTYSYCNYSPDGTLKSVTKNDLDLHNFHYLFRFLLSEISLPNQEFLGPVLNWRIIPFTKTNAIVSLSGPEDSSVEGKFSSKV